MADGPPDTARSGDPILEAEVGAYVRSYLTPEELRRTSFVIDQIAASHSTKRESDNPESTSVLVHWRRFIWATSGLSVALLVFLFVRVPSPSVRLHILSADTRAANLPPELEINIRANTLRIFGAGITLRGSFVPAGDPEVSIPVFLQASDSPATFQGSLTLTNSTGTKPRIIGALLEGVIKVPDVGTNDVSASFTP